MKKNKKYALIISAAAVVVGLGTAAGAVGSAFVGRDTGAVGTTQFDRDTGTVAESKSALNALDTRNLQSRSYTVDEEFSSVKIVESSSNVYILPTKDKTCRVECYEGEKTHYDVRVENDTLNITRRDRHNFIEFGIFSEAPLTVYLPENEYDAIDVSTASGDVEFGGAFTADKVNIDTASGDMSVSSLSCKKLTADGASADIELNNVDCEELSARTTSGEIEFDDVTARELSVRSTSGGIELDDVTARELSVSSTSGDIDLRNVRTDSLKTTTSSGEVELENVLVDGKMSLESTSGDIGLERCDAAELKISSTSGSVYGSLLTGKTFIAHSTSGDIDIPRTDNGGRCEVSTTSGDITLFVGSK